MPVTSITVSVDKEEYSRFERDNSTVSVGLTVAGSSFSGNTIRVGLYKAKRNRDVRVCYKDVTLTNATTYSLQFNIDEILDTELEIPLVRRGYYFIKAVYQEDTSVTGSSNDWLVTLLTANTLKNSFINMVDFNRFSTSSIIQQPSIPGITVKEFSPGICDGFIPITYNYSIDGSDIVRSISVCSGPLTVISSPTNTYLVQKGSTNEYLEVYIDFTLLPTETRTSSVLIGKKKPTTAEIQQYIQRAIEWVEDVVLQVYLEPTKIITEIDTVNKVSVPVGTDIPVYSLQDWDKVVRPLNYYGNTKLSWINFTFPYWPILKFDKLYGKLVDNDILDIELDWIFWGSNNGFIELLPRTTATYPGYFLAFFNTVFNDPRAVFPGFWNFSALVGHRKISQVVIELIAKKAAIDILVKYTNNNGVASTSISRDGISESVSFITGSKYGLYNSVINAYKEWIDQNLSSIKQTFKGIAFNIV